MFSVALFFFFLTVHFPPGVRMITRTTNDVKAEEARDAGAMGVKLQVMLGDAEGVPNFVLRRFQLEPGGHTPRHNHPWEHEVFVLSGSGTVLGGGREDKLCAGKAIFIPSNEEHQFRADADSPLTFLCIIPRA